MTNSGAEDAADGGLVSTASLLPLLVVYTLDLAGYQAAQSVMA